MRSGVIAQKIGMSRVYNDAGEHVPVTVLKLDDCQVVAHRTSDKNGYTAVQLGAVCGAVAACSDRGEGPGRAGWQPAYRAWGGPCGRLRNFHIRKPGSSGGGRTFR